MKLSNGAVLLVQLLLGLHGQLHRPHAIFPFKLQHSHHFSSKLCFLQSCLIQKICPHTFLKRQNASIRTTLVHYGPETLVYNTQSPNKFWHVIPTSTRPKKKVNWKT